MGRPSLYKTLSGERDPRIGTVMKVLAALDVQLTIAPKAGLKTIRLMARNGVHFQLSSSRTMDFRPGSASVRELTLQR